MFYACFLSMAFSAMSADSATFVAPVPNEAGVAVLDTWEATNETVWIDSCNEKTQRETVPEGLRVTGLFAGNPTAQRIAIDRSISLDLSDWNRFELDVSVENPFAFQRASLYFHSGDGWYSISVFVPHGEETLVFLKENATSEGSPAGWGQVDQIRLSFWRLGEQDGTVTLRELRVTQELVWIVTSRNTQDEELWLAKHNAGRLKETLLSLGLTADVGCPNSGTPTEVWEKWFQKRQAIIFSYAFYLPKETRDFLENCGRKYGKPVLFIDEDLRKKPVEDRTLATALEGSAVLREKMVTTLLDFVTHAAGEPISDADAVRAKAQKTIEEQGLPAGIDFCKQTHQENLRNVALRLRESKTLQFRAWWNHDGRGAYPGDWPRTAKELKAAGYTAVFPNLLWASAASYPSDLIPRGVRRYGESEDWMRLCVEACHAEGLEVHVWKVNFNMEYDLPDALREQYLQEGRLQKNNQGEWVNWLCPSHPNNFTLEWQSMVEMAVRYPIDGIHFDYIRYPDQSSCYCEGCRERFEQATGEAVAHWPSDVIHGSRRDAFSQWRCDQITAIVKKTREELRKVRPNVKVSAAVFPDYPLCKMTIGQDWVLWAKEGYVDFLCPMNYSLDARWFAVTTMEQRKQVGCSIPLYPGIAEYRNSPDGTIQQIRLAEELDCPGFILFDLTPKAAETILPLQTP